MIRPGRNIPRYDSLRASRRALARSAPWVRFGLLSIGGAMALDAVQSLVSDAQFTWAERRIIGVVGLTYLGGFGLAGWVVGRLLTASAELIDVLVDQSEASGRAVALIEEHAIPTLGRIALALEKLPAPAPTPAASPPADPTAEAFRAIAEGRWGRADRLVGGFVRDHPGPEAAALLAGLADARRRAVDGLRARLDAAVASGDHLRVVDLRDELTQHLRGPELEDLDGRLVRGLVDAIRKRVQAGTIRADLADLAARVVDSFADTPEGATLRASIPNIRRSAGLCPRCGRPHRGQTDLCPRCRAAGPGATASPVPPSGIPDPEESR